MRASVDGQVVGPNRLTVDPSRPAEVSVTIVNESTDPVRASAVRLSGRALGLTLFAYRTAIVVEVPPRSTVTRSFPVELDGLRGRVTGLLRVSVQLVGPDGSGLAEVRGAADVRGSVWSAYGLLWLAVLAITVLAAAAVVLQLVTARLPANRWQRAMQFLPAGAGAGLSAVLTLSVLRLAAPQPAIEIAVVLGAAVAAFVLGLSTVEAPAAADDPRRTARHEAHHLGGPAPSGVGDGAHAAGTVAVAGAVAGAGAGSVDSRAVDAGAADAGAVDAMDTETTGPITLADELLASPDTAR